MLDTGYWMLDAGYWILDAGCRILDSRYWISGLICKVKGDIAAKSRKTRKNKLLRAPHLTFSVHSDQKKTLKKRIPNVEQEILNIEVRYSVYLKKD